MQLLNKRTQLVLNTAVVILVLAAIILGAVMVLPARSPLGPLMGKFASDVDFLSNMLADTEPKAVAEALNENPEFLSDLFGAMVEEGTIEVVAMTINVCPRP